jgi:hypothetical protein
MRRKEKTEDAADRDGAGAANCPGCLDAGDCPDPLMTAAAMEAELALASSEGQRSNSCWAIRAAAVLM